MLQGILKLSTLFRIYNLFGVFWELDLRTKPLLPLNAIGFTSGLNIQIEMVLGLKMDLLLV